MKIEIGTEYVISPAEKKSFLVMEEFETPTGDIVEMETLYRDGAITITPETDDEVEMIQMAIDGNAVLDNIDVAELSNAEFIEASDGCAVCIDNPEYDIADLAEMEQVGYRVGILGPILVEEG